MFSQMAFSCRTHIRYSSEEQGCEWLQDSPLWKSCAGAEPLADDCIQLFPVMGHDLMWTDVMCEAEDCCWTVSYLCVCACMCASGYFIPCGIEVAYGCLVGQLIFFIDISLPMLRMGSLQQRQIREIISQNESNRIQTSKQDTHTT